MEQHQPRSCARKRGEAAAAAPEQPQLLEKGKAKTTNCIQASLKAPTHFSALGKTVRKTWIFSVRNTVAV